MCTWRSPMSAASQGAFVDIFYIMRKWVQPIIILIGLHPLFVLILILHVQCFNQFDILVFFTEVLQGELVCEEDDRTLEGNHWKL